MRPFAHIICLLVLFSLLPASSAVIQKEEVDITVDAQKRVVRHVTRTVAIHTPAAYRTFGESFFVFNPGLQEIRIIGSTTTHGNGRSFPAPANAFVLQSPRATAQAPDFSHMREQMVSHTALEPGCTVVFEYEIRDKEPHQLVIVEPFDGPFPIVAKRVRVRGVDRGRIVHTGSVRVQGDGVYAIENSGPVVTDSHFSSRRHRSLLYIELGEAENRYRKIFTADTPSGSIADCLRLMKVGESSIPAEVITQVTHFLDERLATVDLHPRHTAYTPRPLFRVCASGYGTSLEKALLAHAVLQHLRIDHSMALVTDLIGDKPDWDLPEIVVATDRPIYPRALQLAGKTSLTLSGAPLPAPEDVRIWVSLRLSETTPGRFAGNLTSETCFDGRGSGADWHPIEGLNTDTEEVLSHSLRGRTSRSRATYDLKNGCLELRFPGDMLALGQLMAALQQTTQLTLSHGIQAQVVVSLEFLKSPSLVAAAGKKVSNKIGAAGFSAAVKGRVLTVKSSLKMGGGGFRRADYADLQALLVPVMSETNRRLFIEVE